MDAIFCENVLKIILTFIDVILVAFSLKKETTEKNDREIKSFVKIGSIKLQK